MPRTAVAYHLPGEPPDPPAGLTVIATIDERLDDKAALPEALELIVSHDAEALLVPTLATAAQSLTELVGLLDWLDAAGGDLIALDPPFDTATRQGRHAVALLREVDRWSREPRRPRGRPGLAAAAPELAERISSLRERGLSLHAIADELNEAGVPTTRGGERWRASSVQAALGYRRPRPPLAGAPPPQPPKPPKRGKPPKPGKPHKKPKPKPEPPHMHEHKHNHR
jgi:hypothetical protein